MRIGLIGLVCVLMINACGDGKSPESTPTATAPTTTEDTTPDSTVSEEISEPKPNIDTSKTEVAATPPPELESVQAEATTTNTPTDRTSIEGDVNKEGLELARKSGCLACHAIDKKVVGPAWNDVAKRYVGDTNAKAKLVEKVAKGGRGNWTEVVGNVAMPPYSPRVSDDNIEKLVDFILSLNNP